MRALRKAREGSIHGVLLLCALVSILTTLGIVWVLFEESFAFFRQVSVLDFLLGTVWEPIHSQKFGVLPLVTGTLQVAVGGLLVAVPVGLATAIFLSEYASPLVRSLFKPVLEVLAGIPTVVYGYFALTFVTPFVLRPVFPDTEQFNAASAGIVVGIMTIPTIASICDDALQSVPSSLREGAYALAATRLEVAIRVVVPAALSGVIAAVLLALARAIGETMAVTIAAGMTPKLTLNPLESIQTMTGYMVQISKGDTPPGSLEFKTVFAVGLALFAMTLIVNLVAQRILARYREAYE